MSALLLDELFEQGDARLLDAVLASSADKKLGGLAGRWLTDARPQVRKMLVRYIEDGCDRARHRLLVKRLFKGAEKAADDELMALFLVAFDRMPRRQLASRWGSKILVRHPDVPATKAEADANGRFTSRTRVYLQRRAWRYFRRLSFRSTERYVTAVARALAKYRDEDLATASQLLDAWGLVHVLYARSPVLRSPSKGASLAPGQSLADLALAPHRPDVWTGHFVTVMGLARAAQARPVARFVVQLLKKHYARELETLDFPTVRALLSSPCEDIQVLGAETLEHVRGLDKLAVREWLALLAIPNEAALPALCRLVEKHVAPSRLSLDECIELACSPLAPVATLGFEWAIQKPHQTDFERRSMLRLGQAKSPVVRVRATEWALALLQKTPTAVPEELRELLDARYEDVRERAIGLLDSDERFATSTKIWAALAESPYDDARRRLVTELERVGGAKQRSSDDAVAALSPESLRHLWATTLLGIHRGGRAKQRVLRSLADRIVALPDEAPSLLPLVRVALRSVRAPERRGALAAIATAVIARPALRSVVAREIPELRLFAAEGG